MMRSKVPVKVEASTPSKSLKSSPVVIGSNKISKLRSSSDSIQIPESTRCSCRCRRNSRRRRRTNSTDFFAGLELGVRFRWSFPGEPSHLQLGRKRMSRLSRTRALQLQLVAISSYSTRDRLDPCVTEPKTNRGSFANVQERRAPVGTMQRGSKEPTRRTRFLEPRGVFALGLRFRQNGGLGRENMIRKQKDKKLNALAVNGGLRI